ncbi:hypothetical protein H5V45_07485 [Nocardioides sp. KIGAM211]|uniref:Uncharacterized protein n=1 Tax=Nocardioides luti TaxID=2761101 RepID=A0A7X0VA34_9ACTN|nr:hypothetical protein [Nocardioides luti]MBB6627161.1 hypothetical protein [Nocardioides luti]
MTDDLPRFEIDWLKTVAGALAAVSSAVLLSTLGAAGTIIGAAVGSVVITVGSALYSQGLARSRYRLAQAQTTALRKVGVAQAEVRRAGRARAGREAESHLDHADERLAEAQDDLEAVADEPATLSWRERLALLPWKRIGAYAAGLFLLAVVVITGFELVAGRSVSSYTGGGSGGTTITHLGGGGGSTGQPTRTPSDSPGQDPSQDPSGSVEPSPSPSTSPTDTASPSTDPSTTPTAATTTQPPSLPTPTPSAVPSG